MSNQWHYSQDGAQYGPVDEAEIVRLIQSGELTPSTPVCKEGGMDWQSAREYACFQVEIYPRKKISTKVAASGESSQPVTQTGALPIIAPSSPAGSFAPTVTNPILAPGASGKGSMSGATILYLVIMLIITIGSVCFSFVKSQEDEDLINAVYKAKREATEAKGKVTKLEYDKADLGKKFANADSVAKASKARYDQLVSNVGETHAAMANLQQENASLNAEKQSWATERQNLQDKANEATIAQTKLAIAKAEVQTLATELDKIKNPAAPVKPKAPTVTAGGKVGKIANVDLRNGSIILNRGSAHGFKVGDQPNVFRNNKLIGRIEVTRLSSANIGLSIARRTEGLGVPAGAQFQVNDDLVKLK